MCNFKVHFLKHNHCIDDTHDYTFLPVYKDFAMEIDLRKDDKDADLLFPPTPYKFLTLSMIVVYYATICGNERIFQSMQFTFGLCGPLRLAPRDAVFIDKMYNIGFTLGR